MARELTAVPTEELLRRASMPEDQQIFAEAVAELVLRYKGLVYSQALWVCAGNQSLADDIFQETFLRLFTWLRSRRGRPPLHTFPRLLTVFTKRVAIDLMRKETREPPPASWEREPSWETKAYVLELLELLDPRPREVVWLTYFEGLSAVEIAKKLKLKPGHVRILKFRALEALRVRQRQDEMADSVEPV